MKNKFRASLKYFRLSLLFAFVVFLILFFTMGLAFIGIVLLSHFGVLSGTEFNRIPLMAFFVWPVS